MISNEVYETIKLGLEDAINGRVRVTGHSVSCWTDAPMVEYAPVVRCKDCKHRPKKPDYYEDGFDLEFPDSVCPCQCEDDYYSWYPQDDWFCANGKQK